MAQIPLLTGPQDPSQIQASLNALITQLNSGSGSAEFARFSAPIAAELVSIKAAATPANGAITIAAQPDFPRKLQDLHCLIGTTTHHRDYCGNPLWSAPVRRVRPLPK